MKSLYTVQVLSKVGKILSTIVFICCIVGLCLAAAGAISYAFLGDGIIKIGGVSLKSFIQNETSINEPTIYAALAVGAVAIIAEMIVSKKAIKYFDNELKDGTPFTVRGAGELKRLGIATIVVPLVAVIASAIGLAVAKAINPDIMLLHTGGYVSAGLGIMMIVMSVVCRYGADLREKAGETDDPDIFAG